MTVNLETTIKGQPRTSGQGEFSLWGKEKHLNVQSITQTKSPINKERNVREWIDDNSTWCSVYFASIEDLNLD